QRPGWSPQPRDREVGPVPRHRHRRSTRPRGTHYSVAAGARRGTASERLDEEQNQRDEQHVDDERLDQNEPQDQVTANLAGCARIARDGLDRRRNATALPEGAERGRDRKREARPDDRPADDLRIPRAP